jgi:hypothetical protein
MSVLPSRCLVTSPQTHKVQVENGELYSIGASTCESLIAHLLPTILDGLHKLAELNLAILIGVQHHLHLICAR